jgi:hypothetical protein
MKLRLKKVGGIIGLLVMTIMLCISLVQADPTISATNTSFTTTDQTPSVWFRYNHATNATASCVLWMDGVNRATNATTNNWTQTALTPTTVLDYDRYNTIVNCSTSDGNSNVTDAITVSVAMIECTGTENTVAGFLITLFMVGLIVALATLGFTTKNMKFLVGAGIGLIIWVIGLGIINPVIRGLCG